MGFGGFRVCVVGFKIVLGYVCKVWVENEC